MSENAVQQELNRLVTNYTNSIQALGNYIGSVMQSGLNTEVDLLVDEFVGINSSLRFVYDCTREVTTKEVFQMAKIFQALEKNKTAIERVGSNYIKATIYLNEFPLRDDYYVLNSVMETFSYYLKDSKYEDFTITNEDNDITIEVFNHNTLENLKEHPSEFEFYKEDIMHVQEVLKEQLANVANLEEYQLHIKWFDKNNELIEEF